MRPVRPFWQALGCLLTVATCRKCVNGWWRTQSRANPSLLSQFPANREKNREFRQICLLREILKADRRANSKALSRFPYATEQGIISEEQGILAPEQGFCLPKTEMSPDEVFGNTGAERFRPNVVRHVRGATSITKRDRSVYSAKVRSAVQNN
jgi:hypothetical protein